MLASTYPLAHWPASPFAITSTILALAMSLAYLNHRFIKMPSTIAVMTGSLIISLGLLLSQYLGYHALQAQAASALSKIDFYDILINGMLGFLLFAGAINIDIQELKKQKWEVGILATVSTLASTLIVGAVMYYLLPLLHIQLPLIYCLLFGALISPTDPIAVLAIFKDLGAPRRLSVIVESESLFNDGVAIVIFLTLYQLAFNGQSITLHAVAFLFLKQAVGGILYGTGLGVLTYWLIKPITDHKMEILITLTAVMAGYSFGQSLHVSAPLAIVVAGLFIGNRGRDFYMSKRARESLDTFWGLIDEVLNAILFLLIGLEILIIKFTASELALAVFAIPVVLLTRYVTVAFPITILKRWRAYNPHAINVMAWGGLRGGLAVALALSLPNTANRHLILVLTYTIVLFSILVQGLTIRPLIRRAISMAK